ncbi:MAG: hybrid sensor histidine kinase/response regulator [Armatimonadota bacterium]
MDNKPIKILLIEDNPGDAHLMKILLTSKYPGSFDIVHAETLDDAFKELDSGTFDVIMSDLGLPDSQGLDTVRSLKQKEVDLPIVVLTSLNDEDIALAAVKEGAQDYMVKGSADSLMFIRSIKYAIERHKLQKEIEAMREEFIATLTHDLKTPIVSMMGFTELVLDPDFGPISDEKVGYVNNIKFSGKILINMINNIVQSSRIEQGQFKIIYDNFSLTKLLDEIKEAFYPLSVMQKVSLEFKCPEDILVYADLNKTRQVFHNLISNAFKFIPENGTISIEVTLKDSLIDITVSDTGKGISKEEQNKIFEKFGQAEGERRGSGLGLYIVKKILEEHDTDIRMESEPGKGTKFFFSLKKGEKE